MVALAFKLEDGAYGQLTYVRVYQGTLDKGITVINVRSGRKIKIGRVWFACMPTKWRIFRQFLPVLSVPCFGIDCASGDTFVAAGVTLYHDLHVRP